MDINYVAVWCKKDPAMLCKNWDGKGWVPTANDVTCPPEGEQCQYLVKPKEIK